MTWLAGVIGAGGLAGAVVLGILIYRIGQGARSDLHALVQSTKDLADARRQATAHETVSKDLQHALDERTAELARERAALVVAQKALEDAAHELASRGDSRSVSAGLNSALKRLSEMSDLPPSAAGEGDHG